MLMIENQAVGLREFYAGQAAHAYNEADFQLAERLFKQALAQSERTGVIGKELAGDVSNVARACHQQAKFVEAEQYYRRAVSLLEASVGNRHPDLADVLHDLARIKCTLGEFVEGRELLVRALAIRSQLFGPTDRQVLATEEELASIPAAGADETNVAKHLPVAKEIPVSSEAFPPSELPSPAQQYEPEPASITSELSLLMEQPEGTETFPATSPPPEKLVPPLRREDKASITLEMSQPLDLHAGQERLVDTNSAVVEEPCAPIQTAAQAVFDLEQPAIQPAVADAVDFEEQPRGRIRPIAIDEEPAPFFDILSSSASRQKPIDLAQFNSRQRQVTDSGPRRRLPRSLVGESLDFSCESGANYDFRPRQQAAPKGVPLSLSITEQHGGSRFWQYIGIGVVFQIIVLCLMAAFCRGS